MCRLFKHLVRHNHVEKNPVSEVERTTVNREEGTTLAFSKDRARRLLDVPDEITLAGEIAHFGCRNFGAAQPNWEPYSENRAVAQAFRASTSPKNPATKELHQCKRARHRGVPDIKFHYHSRRRLAS